MKHAFGRYRGVWRSWVEQTEGVDDVEKASAMPKQCALHQYIV